MLVNSNRLKMWKGNEFFSQKYHKNFIFLLISKKEPLDLFCIVSWVHWKEYIAKSYIIIHCKNFSTRNIYSHQYLLKPWLGIPALGLKKSNKNRKNLFHNLIMSWWQLDSLHMHLSRGHSLSGNLTQICACHS